MIRSDQEEARKLRQALDLYQAGEDLKRQSLRREHPDATVAELENMLVRWLRTRPGAEHGDCPGRSLTLEDLSNR